MADHFNRLIDLRKVVCDMENDLGLGGLSALEKSVLLSIAELSSLSIIVKPKDIAGHRFTESFSKPSIYRALKELEVSKKILKNPMDGNSYSVA